jgi:hypothetical protein
MRVMMRWERASRRVFAVAAGGVAAAGVGAILLWTGVWKGSGRRMLMAIRSR